MNGNGKGKNVATILATMSIIALSVLGGLFVGSKLFASPGQTSVRNAPSSASQQQNTQDDKWSDKVTQKAESQNSRSQDPYSDPVADAAKQQSQSIPAKKALVKVHTVGRYRFGDVFKQATGNEKGYYDTTKKSYAYTLKGDTYIGFPGALPNEIGGIGHPVTFTNAEHYNWLVGDLVLSADDQTLMAIDGTDTNFMQLVIIDSTGKATPVGAKLCNSSVKSTHIEYYIGDLDEFTLGLHGWKGMTALTMGFEVRMEL